jgi:hypothetical protein
VPIHVAHRLLMQCPHFVQPTTSIENMLKCVHVYVTLCLI